MSVIVSLLGQSWTGAGAILWGYLQGIVRLAGREELRDEAGYEEDYMHSSSCLHVISTAKSYWLGGSLEGWRGWQSES